MKSRDPWFPIALMLIVLLAVWLGILGPLPESFLGTIKQWQTIVAATVGLTAAVIAWKSATRQIRQTEQLETRRRSRKAAALRSILPLVLSEITSYGQQTTDELRNLRQRSHRGQILSLPDFKFQPFPTDILASLLEFIEFSDTVDVRLFEKLLQRIQILRARLRDLEGEIVSGSASEYTLESRIVDVAMVYAGAAAAFDFARQRTEVLPLDIIWDNVHAALLNMRLFSDDLPSVYAALERHQRVSPNVVP
jgi:hypothetical protein